MALAFNRVLSAAIATTTINSAATAASNEIDKGDDTLAEDIFMYLTVTGFASTPTGNMQLGIAPLTTTGGTVFDDNIAYNIATVSADAQYDFHWPLPSIPRYCKLQAKNGTNVNTDASAVSAWLEYVAVTA